MFDMRSSNPGTERLQDEWSGLHIFLALAFAVVGVYSALLFVERVIVFRSRRVASTQDYGLGDDRAPILIGLVAACTSEAMNSVWLTHVVTSYAVYYGERLSVYNIALLILSLFISTALTNAGALVVAHGEPLLNGGGAGRQLLPEVLRINKRHRMNKAQLALYQQRANGGEVLAKLKSCGYMTRIGLGGALCGIGVWLTVYAGFLSMRVERAVVVMDASIAFSVLGVCIFGGMVLMFALFNVRGQAARILTSLIMGSLMLGLNALAYAAINVYEAPDEASRPDIYGSDVYDARPFIVAITVLGSVVRYCFMGVAPL